MVHLEVLQAEPFPILMGITSNVTPGWTPSLATAPWGPHLGRGPSGPSLAARLLPLVASSHGLG